jgi:NTE family protein
MKIGLALSGGAARGVAHIGIIKALEEIGIKPGTISGVSAGAIVGAYYAAGMTTAEMLKIAAKTNLFSIKAFRLGKAGLFKPTSLKRELEKHFNGLTFEQLKIPLTVVATDIIKVESCYFSTGELVPVLLATSAIPMIYVPVEYRGKMLVDGGLLNNLPVEPLTDFGCNAIIGCHVNPIDKTVEHIRFRSVIDRSIHIAIGVSVREKMKDCTLFIEPPALSHFGIFDMNKVEEIAKAGYDYVIGMRDEIEKALDGL